MAETDPFGRPKDEDPLASMGWSDAPAAPGDAGPVAAQAAPRSVPVARPERPPGTPPRWSPPPARTPTIGPLVKLLFFGAVLTIIVAIAIPVVSSVVDAVEDLETPSFTTEAPETPGGGEPPTGLQRRSMLLRGNLAPALRSLRREMGGRLRYVRIEAERVDVQVVSAGMLVSGQARWDRSPQAFRPTSGAAGTTFAWSRLDPSAPRRLVEAVTRRAGRPSSRFNYAVLVDAPTLSWQVFLRDGTHYTASADGRRVRRV